MIPLILSNPSYWILIIALCYQSANGSSPNAIGSLANDAHKIKFLHSSSNAQLERIKRYPIQRSRIFRTAEERIEASREWKRKYSRKFTKKNIEEAKTTMSKEELQKFLVQSEKFKESRRKAGQKHRVMKAKEREKLKVRNQKEKQEIVETNVQQPKTPKRKFTEAQMQFRAADVRAANQAALIQLSSKKKKWEKLQ